MISAGALARRLNFTTPETSQRLARLTVCFFYPALIFSAIFTSYTWPQLVANWVLPAGALMIMTAGYIIGLLFSSLLTFENQRQKNSFRFQCTINNYSFLPLPVAVMLWGKHGMAQLLFSTLGSEIAVWTLGILALTGNRFRRENIRLLFNPPLVALLSAVLAVAVKNIPFLQPLGEDNFFRQAGNSLLTVLQMFGQATVPLSMFVAGSRMADLKSGHLYTGTQLYVIILRLVAIPAISIALLLYFPIDSATRLTLVLLATMPSAIASVALSEIFEADAQFAASSVLLTHLFSLLTIPGWLAFLI